MYNMYIICMCKCRLYKTDFVSLYWKQVKQKNPSQDRLLAFSLTGISVYVSSFEQELILDCPWAKTNTISFDVSKKATVHVCFLVKKKQINPPDFVPTTESEVNPESSWSRCDDSLHHWLQKVQFSSYRRFHCPIYHLTLLPCHILPMSINVYNYMQDMHYVLAWFIAQSTSKQLLLILVTL